MIKSMRGWKVINKCRLSARACNWFDDNMKDRCTVFYPINVEVKPKLKGSKLFFFKDKKDALDFADDYEYIVPCIAKNVTKPLKYCYSVSCIIDFWKDKINKKKLSYSATPPTGTYLAESITCLE
jgi:hypothetical protein